MGAVCSALERAAARPTVRKTALWVGALAGAATAVLSVWWLARTPPLPSRAPISPTAPERYRPPLHSSDRSRAPGRQR